MGNLFLFFKPLPEIFFHTGSDVGFQVEKLCRFRSRNRFERSFSWQQPFG